MSQVNTITIKKPRESQFELLRIFAQWMIVFYHLFYEFTLSYQSEHPIYLGIQIPLHIGVLLFVLMSGYFGIRPTVRGGGKLVLMIVVYFVPIALLTDLSNGDIIKVCKDLLIISYPRYWFFRCYLFLFLFSPVINHYLKDIQLKQRIYLIAILAFMSIWVGTSMGDMTLAGGKNLTNFLLLYVIGNTLHEYKDKWQRIPQWQLIASFIMLNAVLVIVWMCFHDGLIGTIIMQLSYPYCSPFLYISAILVFMIFAKLKIQSKHINWFATSVFAVYLIHYQRQVWSGPLHDGANQILGITAGNPIQTIILFFIYSILIYIAATAIDKLLTPFWRFSEAHVKKMSNHFYARTSIR